MPRPPKRAAAAGSDLQVTAAVPAAAAGPLDAAARRGRPRHLQQFTAVTAVTSPHGGHGGHLRPDRGSLAPRPGSARRRRATGPGPGLRGPDHRMPRGPHRDARRRRAAVAAAAAAAVSGRLVVAEAPPCDALAPAGRFGPAAAATERRDRHPGRPVYTGPPAGTAYGRRHTGQTGR